MKIKIGNVDYELNVDKAINADALHICQDKWDNPKLIEVGDVFVNPSNIHVPVVVVEVFHQEFLYQLYGGGGNPFCAFSSTDSFFACARSKQEIAEYLSRNNLIFSHNCFGQCRRWYTKEA